MRDLLVLQNIAAYDTHILAHAQFLSRFENNHSAFIRIKTETEQHSQTLVIPIEIEVKKGEYRTAYPHYTVPIHVYCVRAFLRMRTRCRSRNILAVGCHRFRYYTKQ